MIRIQKLKQPNILSGKRLNSGESLNIRGVTITNNNPFTLYVDTYKRKSTYKPKRRKNEDEGYV